MESVKTKAKDEAQQTELPVFLEIMPGAAERGYLMPLDSANYTVEAAIEAALKSTPKTAEHKLLLESLSREYVAEAGIQVEGGSKSIKTQLRTPLEDYRDSFVQRETPSGKPYKLLRIRVSRPQEGGLFAYWL